ncbi:hypothetical protein KBC80_02930 [Candidatus Woesebacteria bacterium]|jgi:hypothetical protein|nr:hypothetical protein [Candidatus Woesebacteria bacterium]
MDSCAIDGVATIQCLVPLFESLVKAVVSLGGVALFLMLLVGGFNFLFSGGDPKKLEQARGTVTQAIVGIIIMSLAYLILLTIQRFTGVNVTEFSVPIN